MSGWGAARWFRQDIQDYVDDRLRNERAERVDATTDGTDYHDVGNADQILEEYPEGPTNPPEQPEACTAIVLWRPRGTAVRATPRRERYQDQTLRERSRRTNRLIITYSRLAKIERGTPARTEANILSVRRFIVKAMRKNCVRECDQARVIREAVEAVFVPTREDLAAARLNNSWWNWWRHRIYRGETGGTSY